MSLKILCQHFTELSERTVVYHDHEDYDDDEDNDDDGDDADADADEASIIKHPPFHTYMDQVVFVEADDLTA